MLYCISSLKPRKAAGHDGILNEPIIHGDSSVAVHHCLLFNSFIRHDYVPTAFQKGIIKPLLKHKQQSIAMTRVSRCTVASDVKFHECFGLELFHEIFLKYLKKFMMANTVLSTALRANNVGTQDTSTSRTDGRHTIAIPLSAQSASCGKN